MKFKKYRDLYEYASVGNFRDGDYREVKLIKNAIIKGYTCSWSLLITDGYDMRVIKSFVGNTSEAREYAANQLELAAKSKEAV